MNHQVRGRDPRVEVSDVLPLVPDGFWPCGPDARLPAEAAATIEEFAAGCLGQLRQRSSGGDARWGAAVEVVVALAGDDPGKAAGLFAGLTEEQRTAAGIYRLATAAFAETRFGDATLFLAVLAATDEGEPWGLLGLATIAIRHEMDDQALALISGMSDMPERHPRSSSVAAICAMTRGRKADAQAQLAAAARLARKRPEFRPELQLAQRALLLLHLKHS